MPAVTTSTSHSAASWLKQSAQTVKKELGISIGASFLSGVIILVQAWLMAQVCGRAIMDHQTPSALMPLIGAIALLALTRGGLTLVAERWSARAAARVKHQVRMELHERLHLLLPAGMVPPDTGSLVEATTAAVEGLEPYLTRFIPHAVLAALLPPLFLVSVFPLEWRSALVFLFSAPFIPLFMVLIGKGSEELNRRQWSHLSRLSGYLLDLIAGLTDLRLFGAVRRETELLGTLSRSYRTSTMSVLRVAFLSAFTLEFFTTVGTALVAVMIGFSLLKGTLPLATGLFVLFVAPEFYLPLRTLGLSYHARIQGVAAAERIAPLLAIPLPEPVQGNILHPPPEGSLTIELEEVTYRYAGNRGGVHALSLTVPPGGITVLAGESGAGKTTLLRLLAGLLSPQSGRIVVNGIPVADIDPVLWRSRIGFLSQHSLFFTGTVRENLLLGCPDATEHDLTMALEQAAAGEFIRHLPQGIDTPLGDRGTGCSGGELRRLALARVLLRKPGLLVLDEPTAGLDATTEAELIPVFQRLARECTLLVITHREQLIACANRVIVLSGGYLDRITTPTDYLNPPGETR